MNLFDALVPCANCGEQITRRESLYQTHICWEFISSHDVLIKKFSLQLGSGTFERKIEDWQEINPQARLRREYLAWQRAGCPTWADWD